MNDSVAWERENLGSTSRRTWMKYLFMRFVTRDDVTGGRVRRDGWTFRRKDGKDAKREGWARKVFCW